MPNLPRSFYALDNGAVWRFRTRAWRDAFCAQSDSAVAISSADARVILGQNRFGIAGLRWWHECARGEYAKVPEGRL